MVAGTLQARSEDVSASRLFEIVRVGEAAVQSLSGVTIPADLSLEQAARKRFDLVLLPTQFAPRLQASAGDLRLAAWVAKQHERGALVVSLNGAVLLARSGLLDGRQATGPISDQALFAAQFPHVRYTPSRRIVVSGQIISAGGINPTVDVCAHLVERFGGRAAARRFLRHTSTESLPSYEHLGVWSAQFKQHRDEAVLAAQALIEASLAAPPTLATLARAVHLGERTLSRRFAAATGQTLRGYVAECRLELTRILLLAGNEPLTLIADECGYAGSSALVHAFSARFGISPARYRKGGAINGSSWPSA
ncbi:GlxA family transcriptional regulator [Burkholderiaceae bacterium UC74_6]